MSIAENLKRIREAAGLSQPQLAAKATVSQQLISQIERGVNDTTRKLPQIARALGVRVEEIDPDYASEPREIRRVPAEEDDTQHGVEFVEDHGRVEAAGRFERKALLPGEVVERNATAGMGYGGQVPGVVIDGKEVDDVRAVWRLPPDFLHTELRAREADVDFLPVDGDSMIPTLLPGDRVLVNRKINAPGDGLYVIHDGIGPQVKRLETVKGSDPVRVRILSDNPMHKGDEVLASDLPVLGRVICKVTRL
jgi:phage repressor protein C with HTH and peptisase S24 domain